MRTERARAGHNRRMTRYRHKLNRVEVLLDDDDAEAMDRARGAASRAEFARQAIREKAGASE